MNLSTRSYCAATVWLLNAIFLVMGTTSLHAQISCSPTMSALTFGTVDPLSSLTNVNATLTFNCTNSNNNSRAATLCFSIGEPGGAQTNPRRMSSGANFLNFQLYQDPAYSTVWGSSFFGPNTPLQVNVTVPGKSSISTPGSATMYGRVLAGQTSAVPGSYIRSYQSGDTALKINQNNNNTAPGSCGSTAGGAFPFDVSATVIKSCTVTANTLDFGTPVGSLTTNIDSTTTVQATCSNTTAYQIGLDNGQNASGTTRRMAGGSSEFINYELYLDAGRTQRWGNSFNPLNPLSTDTVSGTGTGSAQLPAVTVYGRVPPQTTPSAGSYGDTITVNVTY